MKPLTAPSPKNYERHINQNSDKDMMTNDGNHIWKEGNEHMMKHDEKGIHPASVELIQRETTNSETSGEASRKNKQMRRPARNEPLNHESQHITSCYC